MGQAEWVTVPISTRDVDGPVFFTEHEWDTIEAASARIIPTDHHPGAREAKVVRFIDRMLAGTQFIFPAADGNGFLRMEGRDEAAWQERIKQRREFYREGVVELDRLANERATSQFLELSATRIRTRCSRRYRAWRSQTLSRWSTPTVGLGGAPAGNQPVNEDFLEFFPLLVLNTRQGFYGDPVYGGNENRVGWGVIGFDGPPSLASTMDGSYTHPQVHGGGGRVAIRSASRSPAVPASVTAGAPVRGAFRASSRVAGDNGVMSPTPAPSEARNTNGRGERLASRSKAPRMSDVARLAGVSQQTVSRVVRGATNVDPDIRQRVEHAIAQLRYRRNPAAAALASNRTMTIGVVSFELSVLGPTVALYGISEEARQHGYATRLVTLASLERRDIRAAFESINSDTVDGVIVLAPLLDAITVLEDLDIGVPVVTFQQGSHPSPTSVSVDEVRGARMVVRHLLDLGHETVWHVQGPPGWMATSSRVQGWAAELGAAGRFVPAPLATTDWSAEEGYRVGRELAATEGRHGGLCRQRPLRARSNQGHGRRGTQRTGRRQRRRIRRRQGSALLPARTDNGEAGLRSDRPHRCKPDSCHDQRGGAGRHSPAGAAPHNPRHHSVAA